ncbi:MAG: DUF4278 domain-containing protein [Cyanobacteriota bacterium]|nr:DUF4278 domain-containing protein [Cyanobacteriota bacterium]
MKLNYRGIHYEFDRTPIDMEPGPVKGKYRGRPWEIHYPRHMNVPQAVMALKYRGVAYRTTETGGIATPPASDRIPTQVPKPATLEAQLATVHKAYLLQRLTHRLEVAKAKGDERLVHLLELEQQQIA